MRFKFGLKKSVYDGCEVFDEWNIEVTMDGRVRHRRGGIDNFSKNYELDFIRSQ